MDELNPYTPPTEPAPVGPGEIGPGVVDPSRPALWSNSLTVAVAVLGGLSWSFGWAGMVAVEGALDIAVTVAGLTGLVFFLIWTYRVVANAKVIDSREMRVGPGWAVGGYFIPLVNLVLPCVAMFQASRASGRGGGLVILWWLLTIGQIVAVSIFGMIVVTRSITPEMMETGGEPPEMGALPAVATLSEFAVAWVEVTMVLAITRAQRAWGGTV